MSLFKRSFSTSIQSNCNCWLNSIKIRNRANSLTYDIHTFSVSFLFYKKKSKFTKTKWTGICRIYKMHSVCTKTKKQRIHDGIIVCLDVGTDLEGEEILTILEHKFRSCFPTPQNVHLFSNILLAKKANWTFWKKKLNFKIIFEMLCFILCFHI